MKKICIILSLIFIFTGCKISNNSGYEKKLLKLKHSLSEEIDLSENSVLERYDVDIVLDVSKKDDNKIDLTELPSELIDVIEDKIPDFDVENKNFAAYLNFYSDDGNFGILEIKYFIADNIITNKAVIASFENKRITEICFTNCSFSADEEKIIKTAKDFLSTHEQEKKIFSETEEFISEETLFHYYYQSEILCYCYQLFFYEETPYGKIINNEYISEYIL